MKFPVPKVFFVFNDLPLILSPSVSSSYNFVTSCLFSRVSLTSKIVGFLYVLNGSWAATFFFCGQETACWYPALSVSRAKFIVLNRFKPYKKQTESIFWVVTFQSFFVDIVLVVQRFLSKFLFNVLWCPKPDFGPLKRKKTNEN